MAKNGKAKNGKASGKGKSTKKPVVRTRMSDDQIEKYIKHYAKRHDLKGKEIDAKLRRVAAARLAALERNASA